MTARRDVEKPFSVIQHILRRFANLPHNIRSKKAEHERGFVEAFRGS